ncbi:MAG: Xaa-Pro peptidase family protein [Candidatus Acidiferrales bacterium]
MTATDSERTSRIQEALGNAGFNAVVCALPANVLLLTGYWPVVGESIAICVRDGPTVLLVPEDEQELAEKIFGGPIETFRPGSLHEMTSIPDVVRLRLAEVFHQLKIHRGSIGVEDGPVSEPASYVAVHLYGQRLAAMLEDLLPESKVTGLNRWLRDLRSVKTAFELERIRQACDIARHSYEMGAPRLRAGMKEPEAAALFRPLLSSTQVSGPEIQRRDGYVFCMSGPNSAKAFAAYARTRERTLEPADLAMIHCNSYVDGFWTDITRTYHLQSPGEQQRKMHEAVFAARKAALAAIKPGVRAAEVDLAARQVIQDFGFGKDFKHGTGHGVGFSPMSAYSFPRVHPGSPDVLSEGMVFNVEPAVYIEGYGGVRHCDMVAVTAGGYQLLTNFQAGIESLTVEASRKLKREHTVAAHTKTAS